MPRLVGFASMIGVVVTVTACASGTPAPRTTPAVTPAGLDVHRWSSAASIGYTSLADFVLPSQSVALVRVVEVGPFRWNSPAGDRPPEALLHAAPAEGENTSFIGRLVTVEVERMIRGRWPYPGVTARYWRPGGTVGTDIFDAEIGWPDFAAGDRALAGVRRGDIDLGRGGASIPVQVDWLFPVEPSGRILTLQPTEQVTLDRIDQVLP